MSKKQTIASEIGSALGSAAAHAEQLLGKTSSTKPVAKRSSAKHSKAKVGAKSGDEASVETPASGPIAEHTDELAGLHSAPVEVNGEEVAKLAYLYWEARGCQGGSADEDWARAEGELKRRAQMALSASA